MAKEAGGVKSNWLTCCPTYPETNSMVACIFGTTRSALSMRARLLRLRGSCWATVRIVSMCIRISEAMSRPFRRTPEGVSDLLIWYPLLEDECYQLCMGV